MSKRRTVSGTELQPFVDDFAAALRGIADGIDPETHSETLRHVADQAGLAAWTIGEDKEPTAWSTPGMASFWQIIGANLKDMRVEAGWSQERLAEAVAREGFPWKRITCAEVEAGTRRLSLEELLTLAALFAEPLVSFLRLKHDTVLELPRGVVQPEVVSELLVGAGGKVGRGGMAWHAPARVLQAQKGKGAERPAADWWRTRD